MGHNKVGVRCVYAISVWRTGSCSQCHAVFCPHCITVMAGLVSLSSLERLKAASRPLRIRRYKIEVEANVHKKFFEPRPYHNVHKFYMHSTCLLLLQAIERNCKTQEGYSGIKDVEEVWLVFFLSGRGKEKRLIDINFAGLFFIRLTRFADDISVFEWSRSMSAMMHSS